MRDFFLEHPRQPDKIRPRITLDDIAAESLHSSWWIQARQIARLHGLMDILPKGKRRICRNRARRRAFEKWEAEQENKRKAEKVLARIHELMRLKEIEGYKRALEEQKLIIYPLSWRERPPAEVLTLDLILCTWRDGGRMNGNTFEIAPELYRKFDNTMYKLNGALTDLRFSIAMNFLRQFSFGSAS